MSRGRGGANAVKGDEKDCGKHTPKSKIADLNGEFPRCLVFRLVIPGNGTFLVGPVDRYWSPEVPFVNALERP